MKMVTRFALAFVVLSLSAFAQAQDNDSILVDEYIISQEVVDATVQRVQPIQRTITVRGENRGQTRTFEVPEGTRITVNGRRANLRDIRPGDKVQLKMTPMAERVVIENLAVPASEQTLEERRAEPMVAEVVPATLPKTASQWPLVLLAGFVAMLAAAAIRLVRTRA